MKIITEPCVIDGMSDAVRRIPVGDSNFALIDAADAELIQGHRWNLLKGHNGKLYASSKARIYMHRLIAGTPVGCETDHINGDGLDNRRANLRVATPSQNRANMGKPARPDGSAHTSRFKGVSWDKARGKWISRIGVNGVSRNLGRYDIEEQAARAYDLAAIAAWGEFALVNFSESKEVAA